MDRTIADILEFLALDRAQVERNTSGTRAINLAKARIEKAEQELVARGVNPETGYDAFEGLA